MRVIKYNKPCVTAFQRLLKHLESHVQLTFYRAKNICTCLIPNWMKNWSSCGLKKLHKMVYLKEEYC